MFQYDENLYNEAISSLEAADASFHELIVDNAQLQNYPPEFPYASLVTEIFDEINASYVNFSRVRTFIINSNTNTKGLNAETSEEKAKNSKKDKGLWNKLKGWWNGTCATVKEKAVSFLGNNKFFQALLNLTGAKFSKKIKSKLEKMFGLKSETINPAIGDKNKDKEELRKEKNKKSKQESNTTVSKYKIEPHANITSSERQARLELLGAGGSTFPHSKEYENEHISTISVPIWDGTNHTSMVLRVNKELEQAYTNVFTKLDKKEIEVIPYCTNAYHFEHDAGGSGTSDHWIGSAIDVNWDYNWGEAHGKYANRDNEEIIKIFAEEGFYWGGDWHSSKDDMHFSFTGY